ncbi:HAD family acid phosphatase [[Mycoplasma] phocidae]|nr:HAD family acid phosphatase [[Mycoplasma] phocae]
MKKWKFILGAMSPLAALPLIVASCTNKTTSNESIEDIKKKLEDNISQLSKEQKLDLINKIDINQTLDADQKAELISKFNSGAGIVASIVWFMNSAEARIAQIQAYQLATIAFDNLKKKAANDKMDYSALNSDGTVKNPETGKFVPVVFMDIDETIFVNEYTESWSVVENGGRFSEDKKDSIDAIGKRRAIPGSIDFINHVFKEGGIVMFNSGIRQLRPSIDGIKKNLISAGIDKKYIQDWMFWTSGVNPLKEDGKTYDPTPWITGTKNSASEVDKNFWKVTSKNQRMNGVSDNPNGWDFSKSQAGSGNAVKTRVIMKIGDDFNDFFDDAYKSERNNAKNIEFFKKPEIEKLFKDVTGATGIKVVKEKNSKEIKIENLAWHQFNLQVPGNAMYGGWSSGYGYANYKKLWDALKQINQNSNDNKVQ